MQSMFVPETSFCYDILFLWLPLCRWVFALVGWMREREWDTRKRMANMEMDDDVALVD